MDKKNNGNPITLKKLVANRRNAQLSTGPRTNEGKNHSRRNAVKHGVLTSTLLIKEGLGAEDPAEFRELLEALRQDLEPFGMLEEIMVEKIAVCCWRQKRALRCEAGAIRREFSLHGPPANSGFTADYLSLPSDSYLERILRYETTIQRQLVHAIDQLERSQRTRRGEQVPAPLSVQVSSD